MNFLKGKKGVGVCSNKIAEVACDVFSGAQAKLQSGLDAISINMANRVTLREELESQLKTVNSEIEKDLENIKILEGKKVALAALI